MNDGQNQPDQSVDEGLYSRQLYVYGHEAQRKMQNATILIAGLRGLGIEVAKNVVLAGVKSVSIFDPTPVSLPDLGSNFYLKESHVGVLTRAEASLPELSTLNPYVDVNNVPGATLTEEIIKNYSVIVLLDEALEKQIEVDNICRKYGIKFISSSCEGLMLSIFVDNGPEHIINDPDGNQCARGLISYIESSNPLVIATSDESRHGLSTGMSITFEDVEGSMAELNNLPPQKIKVLTPYSFSIDVDGTRFKSFTGTRAYFNEVKIPYTVSFKTLQECVDSKEKHSIFCNDWMCEMVYYYSLSASISNFRKANAGKYPTPNNRNELLAVYNDFATILKQEGDIDAETFSDKQKSKYFNLIRASSTSLSPMCAIGGGHVGQEVLKAVSGKFTPISQLYYFNSAESFPSAISFDSTDFSEFTPEASSRYDDYIITFGKALQAKVQSQKVFLVGAGAIGCEMLKNWSMMGVATQDASGKKGNITVTDMDSIEKSNLNRQFLFRSSDVGKLKSVAAADAARVMNPALNITAQSLKVSEDTESTYNDTFWQSLNGVYTALDNVDARLYVDSRCVYYGLPLVDSGTLGTAGNTQVIVPYVTESYGSTRDPEEAGIPICTLKNFPHKIEHTIQWARDVFEGDFKQAPDEVNNWIKHPDYAKQLKKEQNTLMSRLLVIKNRLVEDKPSSFEECLLWARKRFDEEFNHKIKQLLHQLPIDAITTEGTPFWSGTKRPPTVIEFNPDDPLHYDFIINAAMLYAFNYNISGYEDEQRVKDVLATYQEIPWAPTNEKIATSEAEAKEMAEKAMCDVDTEADDLIKTIPSAQSLAGMSLSPVEFEKDDDSNHHIAFITACSNLRARNYQIKEESAHETKFIAGKIIPAIATTTALVTGLVCLEMYKLLDNKSLEDFRSSYVTLATNMFAASEPSPAGTTTTVFPNGIEWKWTLWDATKVDMGKEPTLGELIEHVIEKYGVQVSCVTVGNAMVWFDIYQGTPDQEANEAKTITSLLQEKAGITLLPGQQWVNKVDLSLMDQDDEDIDVPPFRIRVAGW